MVLEAGDFRSFFAAMHQGQQPFAWQERLLEALLQEGRWPERIIAPTGAGKTAVLDVHAFAVALMAVDRGPRVPRRLSLVVDRRALVDSQYGLAQAMNRTLKDTLAQEDGVVAEVARALLSLRSTLGEGLGPLVVALLRGGTAPSRRWVDDPGAATILCATPDMWGSRLLFRGYGTAQTARPRDAGLLAYDSVVVVDEAHLARQLTATARRIEAIEAMASAPLAVGVLQVVEATATPPRSQIGSAVGVAADDLETDAQGGAALARRLRAPKPLSIVPVQEWPAGALAARRSLARTFADEAEELLTEHGRTVLCVANTVGVALATADELRGRGHAVEVLVGRMRPHDIAQLRERRPGLLTITGDPHVDMVVATQTIEVGIDADFSAMVTELAPGAAIAQRAGRVNRLGARSGTAVRVLAPTGVVGPKGAPPYEADELAEGWQWLRRRAEDPAGLAPWSIALDPPPESELGRTVLGRLEPWDVALLARTSDEIIADPDLALWLADELEPDLDAALVVRAGLCADPVDALALLRATPPRAAEAFPVSVVKLASILGARPDVLRFRYRDGSPAVLEVGDAIRPGDIVVVEDTAAWFTSGVVDPDGTERSDDVLEARSQAGQTLVRIGPDFPLARATRGGGGEALLDSLLGAATRNAADGRVRRAEMADAIEAFRESRRPGEPGPFDIALAACVRLLRGRMADLEVTFGPSLGGAPPRWVVLADVRRHVGDEEARQTWSGAPHIVLLKDHQAAVAARARAIAERVGLGRDVADALLRAGALHDEGKRDARFQRQLRADLDTEDGVPVGAVLAKSGLRTPADFLAARAASGLPSGWRHEQLSAAAAAAGPCPGGSHSAQALVVRLVGASHGHGRVGFPHTGASLVEAESEFAAAAGLLYDDGLWDDLIETTHRDRGIWGCAYLEAVLRAADGQVSREGG